MAGGRARRFDAAPVRQALRRGVDRLLEIAGPAGWHGFRTHAGESDIWVSAFVVARIGRMAARRRAVRRARLALAGAQQPSGGWSFAAGVPADADSTAWALLGLERTRLLDACARDRAAAFLAGHEAAHGYRTYAPEGGIAEFVSAGERSIGGWTSEHPDVTAAVLAAGPPGIGRQRVLTLLGRLVERQSGAGWWPAYWWRAPQYTTALLLRALRRHRLSLPAEREARLLEALAREQLSDGGYPLGGGLDADSFATALGLESLSHLGGGEARDLRARAGRALLAGQLDDGGWTGDFQLQIPPPDVPDAALVSVWALGGRGGASYVSDHEGLFATAQACSALWSWLAAEREPPVA